MQTQAQKLRRKYESKHWQVQDKGVITEECHAEKAVINI